MCDRSSRRRPVKKSSLKKLNSNEENETLKKRKAVATASNSKRRKPKSVCIDMLKETTKILKKLYEAAGAGGKYREFHFPMPLQDATVNNTSLDRLCPGEFLNDELINFYCIFLSKVKYVDHQDDFIIFSPFFYESLCRMFSPAAEFNIKRLQRPKGVNIFEKRFVIIPLNLGIHWILLVICLPNLITKYLDYHVNDLPPNQAGAVYLGSYPLREKQGNNRPCMVIFDSLKAKTPEVIKFVRCYLTEEYKQIYGISVDFSGLPGYHIEGLRQDNLSDSGITTLQNIELVLENMKLFPFHPPNLIYKHYADNPLIDRLGLLKLIVDTIIKSRKE